MNLSHSKLNLILTCPMSYYLNYIQGISLKTEKSALAIGSAVHWGIEHNTEDLQEYYNENGNFKQKNNYTKDELLAESMVHGYLKCKDALFTEILKDLDDDKPVELLEEIHELELYADLPSKKFDKPHNFMGIIDLLLMTNKGFIVIDYKTSSDTPDWDKYLDQIYRYIYLLRFNFPDVPVYKIGIINLRKSKISQRQKENQESFFLRLKTEYDINEGLISSHIYLPRDLDPELLNDYIDNLSNQADTAQMIDNNKCWFINYTAANGPYGKGAYWDIFYNTKDSYLLYKIRDTIFDEDDGVLTSRDCLPIDLQTLKHNNVLNHFAQFENRLNEIKDTLPETFSEKMVLDKVKEGYITDDNLLKQYWKTFLAKKDKKTSSLFTK